MQQESQEPEEPSLGGTEVKLQAGQQKTSPSPSCPDTVAVTPAGSSPPVKDRMKAASPGACTRYELKVLERAWGLSWWLRW